MAHLPPPAYLEVEITDTKVDVLVVLGFDAYQAWLGGDPAKLDPKDATARETMLRAQAGLMEVRVDGAAPSFEIVEVETSSFEDHERLWSFVKIRYRVTTPGPAQEVSLHWKKYEDVPGHTITEVECEWVGDHEFVYPVFKPREPAYTWHRPRAREEPPPPALPPPPSSRPVMLPLLSLLLLLGCLLDALLWGRGRRLRRVGLGLALGGLAAFATLRTCVVPVHVPWDRTPTRPSETEARRIFAYVHSGIYKAVQGDTESAIYDRLAEVVTPELVPVLYLDIRQSMILHKEGGVVARVHEAEILTMDVLPAREEGARWFEVEARWRVRGRIGHFGHTHHRVNEVLARVMVVPVGEAWKITAIEVLDEERVSGDD